MKVCVCEKSVLEDTGQLKSKVNRKDVLTFLGTDLFVSRSPRHLVGYLASHLPLTKSLLN